MKKKYLLILVIPFFLTGCFGLTGKGYLKNTCTKEIVSGSLTEKDEYIVNFKSGVISDITLTKTYTSNDDISYLNDSLDSYKKAYQNTKGVKVSTEGYSIKYAFDLSKVDDSIKNAFNLKTNYNEQKQVFKGDGIVCK